MRFMKQIIEDILERTVGKGMIVTARQSNLTELKESRFVSMCEEEEDEFLGVLHILTARPGTVIGDVRRKKKNERGRRLPLTS